MSLDGERKPAGRFSRSGPLVLAVEDYDSTLLVRVGGDLDLATVGQVTTALEQLEFERTTLHQIRFTVIKQPPQSHCSPSARDRCPRDRAAVWAEARAADREAGGSGPACPPAPRRASADRCAPRRPGIG
jgi:hypothetical protein